MEHLYTLADVVCVSSCASRALANCATYSQPSNRHTCRGVGFFLPWTRGFGGDGNAPAGSSSISSPSLKLVMLLLPTLSKSSATATVLGRARKPPGGATTRSAPAPAALAPAPAPAPAPAQVQVQVPRLPAQVPSGWLLHLAACVRAPALLPLQMTWTALAAAASPASVTATICCWNRQGRSHRHRSPVSMEGRSLRPGTCAGLKAASTWRSLPKPLTRTKTRTRRPPRCTSAPCVFTAQLGRATLRSTKPCTQRRQCTPVPSRSARARFLTGLWPGDTPLTTLRH